MWASWLSHYLHPLDNKLFASFLSLILSCIISSSVAFFFPICLYLSVVVMVASLSNDRIWYPTFFPSFFFFLLFLFFLLFSYRILFQHSIFLFLLMTLISHKTIHIITSSKAMRCRLFFFYRVVTIILHNKKKTNFKRAYTQRVVLLVVYSHSGGLFRRFCHYVGSSQEMVQQPEDCLAKGSDPVVPHKLGMSASLVVVTNWIKLIHVTAKERKNQKYERWVMRSNPHLVSWKT